MIATRFLTIRLLQILSLFLLIGTHSLKLALFFSFTQFLTLYLADFTDIVVQLSSYILSKHSFESLLFSKISLLNASSVHYSFLLVSLMKMHYDCLLSCLLFSTSHQLCKSECIDYLVYQ